MITVTQTRNGNSQSIITFDDPLKAAVHFAEAYLAYGALIREVQEGYVQVETKLFRDVSVDSVEGSHEEMKLILELVRFYVAAMGQDDSVLRRLERPQLPKLILPRARVHTACMLAFGVKNEKDLMAGTRLQILDLIAALQLMRESACSFSDAL